MVRQFDRRPHVADTWYDNCHGNRLQTMTQQQSTITAVKLTQTRCSAAPNVLTPTQAGAVYPGKQHANQRLSNLFEAKLTEILGQNETCVQNLATLLCICMMPDRLRPHTCAGRNHAVQTLPMLHQLQATLKLIERK
jgi:hypothetical protein